MKAAASSAQGPPTSSPKTMRRRRHHGLINATGYKAVTPFQLSWWLVSSRATPFVCALRSHSADCGNNRKMESRRAYMLLLQLCTAG